METRHQEVSLSESLLMVAINNSHAISKFPFYVRVFQHQCES